MELWVVVVSSVLFALSFWLLLQRSLSRILLAFLVLSNAANLLIFTSAGLTSALSPVMVGESLKGLPHADPLPQALVLTAIVIGMGVLAFFIALVIRLKKSLGVSDVDQLLEE